MRNTKGELENEQSTYSGPASEIKTTTSVDRSRLGTIVIAVVLLAILGFVAYTR